MKVIDNENIEVLKLEIEIENTGHITNTYVVKDKKTSKVCVIDPAFDSNKIKESIKDIDGVLDSVIITHSHADHIAALAGLANGTDVKVYIHKLDEEGLWNKELNAEEIVKTKVDSVDKARVTALVEGNVVKFGETELEAIHTPGHTKGSIILLDNENNLLYSGDTIFENSYGRTDLITGNHDDMKLSLDKLSERFEDILVLPGHGVEFNFKNSKRKIRLLFAFKG